MSDKSPPPSITERILADPGAFSPGRQQDGQPTPQQVGGALADAMDAAATLRAWLQGGPVHVDEGRTGQLAPHHSPTLRDARNGRPDGWSRARHPADRPPPSITESILRDPGRHLPAGPGPVPGPGHHRDPGREA